MQNHVRCRAVTDSDLRMGFSTVGIEAAATCNRGQRARSTALTSYQGLNGEGVWDAV